VTSDACEILLIILQLVPLLLLSFKLIQSELDYCNSLLLNLPSTRTKRLQLVPNAAALLSPKLLNFITFLPILISLHWPELFGIAERHFVTSVRCRGET
jgi:hypothetical protein